MLLYLISFFFFFNDTATTEIYTLSLHDALPIYAAMAPESPPTRTGGDGDGHGHADVRIPWRHVDARHAHRGPDAPAGPGAERGVRPAVPDLHDPAPPRRRRHGAEPVRHLRRRSG